MQKWYNKLSKGQKLTILIPALALGFVIGVDIGDVGGGVLACMAIVSPFIFFELGKKK